MKTGKKFCLWMLGHSLVVLFCLFGIYANAKDKPLSLEVDGRWIQGAMLRGKVEPGINVQIADREVYVDSKGEFVFGLGRDEKAEFQITLLSGNGDRSVHSYSIEQRKYKLQKIEGVEKKYVSPPDSVLKRIREDNKQVRKARQTMRETEEFANGFVWPAEGPVTGVYGSQRIFNGVPKRPHYGLDIAGPIGAKIIAPAAGKVTLVHPDMYYSGGTLIIDHGQGISSTFIHLNKILVTEGEEVKQGDLIAEMGATGRVTGPHLDWRVNWFNTRLDPAYLLPERKVSE